MPAARVPGVDSPKAEPGQSSNVVDGVDRSNIAHRMARAALPLALLTGALILGGCSPTPSASSSSIAGAQSSICAKGPPRLTPVTGSAESTLPPSHDNDVGRMRLPDLHPDADIDASQVPKAGRCRRS